MNNFKLDVVDFNENFELSVVESKEIYNTDGLDVIFLKNKKVDKIIYPPLKNFLNVNTNYEFLYEQDAFGTLIVDGNSTYSNNTGVILFSGNAIKGKNGRFFVNKENFHKVCNLFTARKTIQPNWINCKDEYLAPNEQHEQYQQFSYDSIVYSLFNNSSQQSALNQIDYKNKLWNIKNEFFWLSKNQMIILAEEHHYDALYRSAKNADERFVFDKLFNEEIYNKLSQEAKDVLDYATDLVKKSIAMRKIVSEEHPEYHLDCWDCGYAQLKLVWKEYFRDEFKIFRDLYSVLERKMRPMVYELGFLRR